MKFLGKTFILIVLLMGSIVRGSELEEQQDQKTLDRKLLEAVYEPSTDKVRTLLLQKANPTNLVEVKGVCCFRVPFLEAIKKGQVEAVALMLSRGADANLINLRLEQPIQDFPLNIVSRKISDEMGGPPSFTLPRRPDRADLYAHIADLLLHYGANPNKLIAYGTALDAVFYCIDGDLKPLYEVIALLLEHDANDTEKTRGKTIHDFAAERPELRDFLNYRLKERRRKIKSSIADAIPTMGLDPVGVISGYVI